METEDLYEHLMVKLQFFSSSQLRNVQYGNLLAFLQIFVLHYLYVTTVMTVCILFLGHSKAVRDICFNNDGSTFLSAAYDRYCKLWDTETGIMHFLRILIYHIMYFTLQLIFFRSVCGEIYEQKGSVLRQI